MTEKIRYYELDFIRVLPMLFMPMVHVYEEFLMHGFATSEAYAQGYFIYYLAICGAPAFMIGMGMNLVFTSHSTPKELAHRGVRLILLFYGLNILRYVIPGMIAILCGDTEAKLSILRHFFCSDIFFFSGFVFLFFALMKNFSVKPFYILIISVLMLVVNMVVPKPQLENEILAIALGKFFYVNGWSCFPVLSWMTFPAIGYCLGFVIKMLKGEGERHVFWNKIFIGGVVGFVAISACLSSYGLDPILIASSPMNNYITDPLNVVLDVFATGFAYGLSYYLYLLLRKNRIVKKICNLSRDILVFYCVHWVLVGWLEYMMLAMGLRNHQFAEFGMMIGIAVIIMMLSVVFTFVLKKFLNKIKSS